MIGLGFLLLASTVNQCTDGGIYGPASATVPDATVTVFYVLNLVLTFLIIWFLFAIIFKVLPDAKIRWKNVSAGALFTALLFMGGKFLITFYIGRSDVGSSYGTMPAH